MPPAFVAVTCLFRRPPAEPPGGSDGAAPRRRLRYRSITLRVIRYFWRQWRDELTPAGKCLVWGICVTGLGTISVQMPVYQLFCGLVTLLAAGAGAGFVFRPRVTIRGEFPDRVTAARPMTAAFAVKNERRLPTYDVGLAVFGLPDTFEAELDRNLVSRIGPGEEVPLSVTLMPKRRGRYQLPPLRAYSTFPFYLSRSGNTGRAMPPLLVVPAFEPLAALSLPVGTRYQPGGVALTSRIGESPEYIGNREYVPGEPVKRLDFRAWARTGRPVVREYSEEYYSRVALVLDTYVSSGRRPGPDGDEVLEAAVSLTAAVAEALSHGEYLIDLFAAGPELHVFRSGRHTSHFENVLEILAGVEASNGDPFVAVGPAVAEELTRVSTAVCVLVDWTESRRRLCEQVIEAGCQLKVLLVARDDGRVPTPEVPGAVVLRPSDVARGGLEVR